MEKEKQKVRELGFKETKPNLFMKEEPDCILFFDYRNDVRKSYAYDYMNKKYDKTKSITYNEFYSWLEEKKHIKLNKFKGNNDVEFWKNELRSSYETYNQLILTDKDSKELYDIIIELEK